MGSYLRLAVFGLKHVLGGVVAETVQSAVKFVEQHFADNSQTLPRALAKANDRAWKTLSIALAGDGWFDNLKNWFAAGDEKAFAEQVRLFLKSSPFQFDGSSAQFRKKCLADLNAARQSGLLSARNPSPKEIAKQTASFQRYTDREGMIEGAEQVVAGIADDLAEYPNLAKLLRQATAGGPPLLVAAFAYFFRREVETDEELAHGLFFDGLRQLSASQEQAFEEVGKALTTLGQNFEQVFDQLARIEEIVVETQTVTVATHAVALDMQVEMQRLASQHLTNADEVRRLHLEVLNRLSQLAMQRGEVKPQHSFSIRSEEERNAVKQYLARFRQLPAEQQKQCPALLNGIGKLQNGSGDFGGAKRTFLAVSANITEPTAQAEAQFNAYRAALQEKKWAEALTAIDKAATLDSLRFAQFPPRYQAKKILGAGGFGTAFLCYDRKYEVDVVVKTLHAADLELNMSDVFLEAKALRRLNHPAIIRVHEGEFADQVKKARPYIVMDYFPGGSLENFIQERGTILPADLIAVAKQIALGMHASHEQRIFHRDLKPANVLVRKEGAIWKVMIIDFGLALRRGSIETSNAVRSAGNTLLGDSVAGTWDYAAPEQKGKLKGVKTGSYSDVYAFGKLCCFALFRTTEPTDRLWKGVPENIRTGLKEMLEQCREEELMHRLPNFDPVLKMLRALDPSKKSGEEGRQEEDVGARQPAEREAEKRRHESLRQSSQEEHGRTMDIGLLGQYAERQRKEKEQEEARQKAEVERKRREEELKRLQKEGETKLAKFIWEALDRAQGKPTAGDTAAAKDIWQKHGVTRERANQILDDVRERWIKAQAEKEEQEQVRRQQEKARKEAERNRREREEAERKQREKEEASRQQEELARQRKELNRQRREQEEAERKQLEFEEEQVRQQAEEERKRKTEEWKKAILEASGFLALGLLWLILGILYLIWISDGPILPSFNHGDLFLILSLIFGVILGNLLKLVGFVLAPGLILTGLIYLGRAIHAILRTPR